MQLSKDGRGLQLSDPDRTEERTRTGSSRARNALAYATAPERYAASLLGSIIGGGTSSRLWQKVREERGLAYSVGAAGSAFSDVGVFNVYAGTRPNISTTC